MSNTYLLSTGERKTKVWIDGQISKKKREYHDHILASIGHRLCERCTKNSSGCKRLQISHIISVDECQKMGMADLAYDFSDMEMLGESCHRDIESWPGLKRKLWFKMRSEGKSFMAFLKEWANR